MTKTNIAIPEDHTPSVEEQIAELRSTPKETLRPTVPALEDILYKIKPVLDHGFVRVIDYMGDDSAVVQAARVSYGRGTKAALTDRGLIRYLMRHRHSTPFEMAEIKFHIKLPIFIARQWIRHRTASVNEYSARYSILDNEFYLPMPEYLARQSDNNRQGRGELLSYDDASRVIDMLKTDAERCYSNYEEMLDPEGIALSRELARINLTLNTYTQWYWKVDLHNLMHFLSLRADSHAQREIQDYANTILDIMAAWTPMTHEAFRDYRMGAFTLSATMLTVVQRLIAGEQVSQQDSGLSKRDWAELQQALSCKA